MRLSPADTKRLALNLCLASRLDPDPTASDWGRNVAATLRGCIAATGRSGSEAVLDAMGAMAAEAAGGRGRDYGRHASAVIAAAAIVPDADPYAARGGGIIARAAALVLDDRDGDASALVAGLARLVEGRMGLEAAREATRYLEGARHVCRLDRQPVRAGWAEAGVARVRTRGVSAFLASVGDLPRRPERTEPERIAGMTC